MKYFYSETAGYWETTDDPSDQIISTYPVGTIEVSKRPNALHDYIGGVWVLNQDRMNDEIRTGISNHRGALEKNVVEYEGHSSYCDKESETGLNECINNIMDSGGNKTISWEGPSGYTVASLSELSGLRKTVVDYRQKTRDAERLTLEQHGETPFESIEDAIDALNGYMED